MKVVSIDNWIYHLTKGKVYDVLSIEKVNGVNSDDIFNLYIMLDDTLTEGRFMSERFVSLDDIRDDKLNKLGI